MFAHASAELDAFAVALVRGAFEYQGQKCSAASRLYVPRSLAAALERAVIEIADARFAIGDPADFSNFMGAVIGAARLRSHHALPSAAARADGHAGSCPAAARTTPRATSSSRR